MFRFERDQNNINNFTLQAKPLCLLKGEVVMFSAHTTQVR